MINLDDRILTNVLPIVGAKAFAVLVVLAKHMNAKTKVCYPSVKTICGMTGLGRDAVNASVKILQEHGLVTSEMEKRKGKFARRKFKIKTPLLDVYFGPQKPPTENPLTGKPDTACPATESQRQPPTENPLTENPTLTINNREQVNQYEQVNQREKSTLTSAQPQKNDSIKIITFAEDTSPQVPRSPPSNFVVADPEPAASPDSFWAEVESRIGLPQARLLRRLRSELKAAFENFGKEKFELLLEWLAYKNSKRQAYKSTKSLEKIIQNFQAHNIEQCKQTLERSITSNYDGIFFDRFKHSNRNNNHETESSKRKKQIISAVLNRNKSRDG